MIFTRNIQQMLADLLRQDVMISAMVGVPVNGTSGTGAKLFGIGSLVVNVSTGIWYTNTGTKASPTWTVVGAQT